MFEQKSQSEYWAKESQKTNYFDKQLKSLRALGVDKAIEKSLIYYKGTPRKILEIGGGSQFVSRLLCNYFPQAEVICTDLCKDRILLASEYYGNIPNNMKIMTDINAAKMPFPNESFDIIVGDAMLHHIDDLKGSLFEINRCLADNGMAVFVREPVIGYFGLIIYKLLHMLNMEKKHIINNRFEYKRLLSQWKYEFWMSGFDVKLLKRWKNQGIYWSFRANFPSLLPCYISFILRKKVKTVELELT